MLPNFVYAINIQVKVELIASGQDQRSPQGFASHQFLAAALKVEAQR
jgi:hypothetical protein